VATVHVEHSAACMLAWLGLGRVALSPEWDNGRQACRGHSRLCQAPHCRRLTVDRPPSSSALAQLSGGTPAVHETVLHTYTPADPRTHHTCLHTEHSSRETSHIFNTVWTHACDTVFAFDQCSIIDRVYIGTHAVHSTVPGAVQPRSILPHSVMISNVRSSSHLSAFG
jgi:hypothetical protein